MKIFNWVQRRFQHGAFKEGLPQSVRKAESLTNEADKKALLKEVALVNVLDGWKDGILTIGTLGFDPLKPFNQLHAEYSVLEHEDDDEDEDDMDKEEVDEDFEQKSFDVDDYDYNVESEDEEENPLMFTSFDYLYDEKPDVILVAPVPPEPDTKKKGERKTLAELFKADSETAKKLDETDAEFYACKKHAAARAKNGMKSSKKLKPNVAEDARPVKKKMHQSIVLSRTNNFLMKLMRRLLKRKIHPELESKGHKSGGVEDAVLKTCNEAFESASLLPTSSGIKISDGIVMA